MTINAILHLHASDDPKDFIPYSFETALQEAQKQGINAIALTCHNLFISKNKYQEIADKYGILFISGVEKIVEGRDVVVLNCDESIKNVFTFEALHIYKRTHPNCFVIAPHPYFPGGYSLREKLKQNKNCFDAIELSWFYSKYFDFDKKAKLFAEQNGLPYIATPDAHRIKQLCTGYITVEAFEFSESALFDAIRKQKYKNITAPKKMWELFIYWIIFQLSQIGKHKKTRRNI
jgi:predicted metal-dependent phosphoesterase TrpH